MPGIICLIFSAACSTGQNIPFGMIEKSAVIKKGRIAILAANGLNDSVRVAEMLSERLAKEKSLTVIDQDSITRVIPGYPGMEFPDNNRVPDSLSPESRGQLMRFRQLLGADYMVLIWVYKSEARSGIFYTRSNAHFGAKLVAFPSCRVIGYSEFSKNDFSPFQSANDSLKNLYSVAVQEIVEHIGKYTK